MAVCLLALPQDVYTSDTIFRRWLRPRLTFRPTDNSTNPPPDRPTDQPTDLPASQPTSRQIDRPVNRPTDQSTYPSTDISTGRPTDRPAYHPTHLPTIAHVCSLFGQPALTFFLFLLLLLLSFAVARAHFPSSLFSAARARPLLWLWLLVGGREKILSRMSSS